MKQMTQDYSTIYRVKMNAREGHRGYRRFHRNLSTPISHDNTAILVSKERFSNSTSKSFLLFLRQSFRIEVVCRAGGGGGGGLGGKEGEGPSMFKLANESISAGLLTWRRTWRPSGAG